MKTVPKPVFAILFGVIAALPLPALAQVPPPYDKLNLNAQQADRITNLDQDWKQHYQQIGPRLKMAQQRLVNLLATPKSDPLDVTSQQQHVNMLKEQLSEQATANYLRKRSLLNADQQRQLEGYLKRMVAERRQRNY